MADRIVLNTISYHGHGAIENIVPELTARGYKKAFVCSDPDLIKFGVTKKVTDLLDAANFAYSVYSEIKPNPTIANVQDGVAAFKAAEADCIVAIGGGSSMDTAKAIGVIINNPEFADVRSLEGVAPTKKHAVFTIAVPTLPVPLPRSPSTMLLPTWRRSASSSAWIPTISRRSRSSIPI